MRAASLAATFVFDVPEALEPARLYVSTRHATAAHLCACGCGCEVVTPIDREGWTMTWDGMGVSLHPSVGSWSLPCRSHYLIQESRVIWLPDGADDPGGPARPTASAPPAVSIGRLASRAIGLLPAPLRRRLPKPWWTS